MQADISILSLFLEASPLVKAVMLILLAASVVSWTFIIQRFFVLKQARQLLRDFEQRFEASSDLNRLYDYLAGKRHETVGIENIFKSGFRQYARLIKQDQVNPDVVLDGAERSMRVALSKEEQALEVHLPFLASIGSISVYIGLFGTVWGIMTAFRALGTMQQATLAMVAPGISEALIATALGLFAAIPAVFAYNRYSQHVQNLLCSYDNLSEEFLGMLHRQLCMKDKKIKPISDESHVQGNEV